MTKYRLASVYNTRYKITNIVDSPLPLNTPIMFIEIQTKTGSRLGFKRLSK